MESPLFTIPEAAAYLRVCTMTMYSLVNSKTFPSIKIGRHHKVLKDHLDAWILAELKTKQKGLR